MNYFGAGPGHVPNLVHSYAGRFDMDISKRQIWLISFGCAGCVFGAFAYFLPDILIRLIIWAVGSVTIFVVLWLVFAALFCGLMEWKGD
jgi:hypothetical protein